jgi:hypothetical protein
MRRARNKGLLTKTEYEFIVKHWSRIKVPDRKNRYIPKSVWNKAVFYECDLVGNDGKCTDYENRIRICKDFPKFDDDGVAMISNLITDKCGFMKEGFRDG